MIVPAGSAVLTHLLSVIQFAHRIGKWDNLKSCLMGLCGGGLQVFEDFYPVADASPKHGDNHYDVTSEHRRNLLVLGTDGPITEPSFTFVLYSRFDAWFEYCRSRDVFYKYVKQPNEPLFQMFLQNERGMTPESIDDAFNSGHMRLCEDVPYVRLFNGGIIFHAHSGEWSTHT